MSFDIYVIKGKKMKTINVNGTRYYINTKDDLVFLTHELVKSGYSITEIASILGVRESTVKKYMQDCW